MTTMKNSNSDSNTITTSNHANHNNNNDHNNLETTPLISNNGDNVVKSLDMNDDPDTKMKHTTTTQQQQQQQQQPSRWTTIRTIGYTIITMIFIMAIMYYVGIPIYQQQQQQQQADHEQEQQEQTVIVVPDYENDIDNNSNSIDNHITDDTIVTTTNNNNNNNNKIKETITTNPTIEEENDTNREPNILLDKVPYRVVCEYYARSSSSSTSYFNTNTNRNVNVNVNVKIIQTSLHEAAVPWITFNCIVHPPNTPVQINVANTPDAMFHINFTSTTTSTSSSTSTSTSTSSSHDNNNNRNVRKMPTILGFGGAFTEATTLNFQRLSSMGQDMVIELLFGNTGLGYSIGRIPIHSCDFSIQSYTFDDIVDDFTLQYFDTSLHHDRYTIDFLKRSIQTYNTAWRQNDDDDTTTSSSNNQFKLVGSPWSPPSWMKRPTWEDTKDAIYASKMTYSAQPNCLRDGVHPTSKYAKVWAQYISKYITSYETQLVQHPHSINTTFWGITVQNEPEFAAPWEACSYTAMNMTEFVAYHLGPIMSNDHPNVNILAFDHNKDHINTWMLTMLNDTKKERRGGHVYDTTTTTTTTATAIATNNITTNDPERIMNRTSLLSNASLLASKYIAGTAYHWYAGGMDRLLDGALGTANLHRFQDNLANLGLDESSHILLGTEACHCPSTGYAGGDINIYWSRAERYAHTVLADLAAGSQGWVEWNMVLDGIGGPNHLGNICDAPILAVPHRALGADSDITPLPDFEMTKPMGGQIIGDARTREELNALGFPAKYLDLGIAVQPMYYYMGHISRYVRPGSVAVPAIVLRSLGNGDIFRPVESTVAGGGQNDLARDGIELLIWPCEGSTRQQFKWNYDESQHIVVFGHDWLGNQTKSCIGRAVDDDFMGMRLTSCTPKTAGKFEVMPIADDDKGRFMIRLLNHPTHKGTLCLTILELKNGGGTYGSMGGAQVALGDCSDPSAKWSLDFQAGEASSLYFAEKYDDEEVCITTGWPFLQIGAFHTPAGTSSKTIIVLNEAKNSANYAIKDDGIVILTGSIPPRSIQTILID